MPGVLPLVKNKRLPAVDLPIAEEPDGDLDIVVSDWSRREALTCGRPGIRTAILDEFVATAPAVIDTVHLARANTRPVHLDDHREQRRVVEIVVDIDVRCLAEEGRRTVARRNGQATASPICKPVPHAGRDLADHVEVDGELRRLLVCRADGLTIRDVDQARVEQPTPINISIGTQRYGAFRSRNVGAVTVASRRSRRVEME